MLLWYLNMTRQIKTLLKIFVSDWNMQRDAVRAGHLPKHEKYFVNYNQVT